MENRVSPPNLRPGSIDQRCRSVTHGVLLPGCGQVHTELAAILLYAATLCTVVLTPAEAADADSDGLPDGSDTCPIVEYESGFDPAFCDPMDQNPNNDTSPVCKARERVLDIFTTTFVQNIAFSVVVDNEVYFADAFEYLGGGNYQRDPEGIHKLYRIGSTSKSVVAVLSKILEAEGTLSLDDYVNDEDATRVPFGGDRQLRDLLAHDGCFKTDAGVYLFCYPGSLTEFWEEPDEGISPLYGSSGFGNLGGGFDYSAFNYSLAGAYLTTETGETLHALAQNRLFDPATMCTASFDGSRATGTPIGSGFGTSQFPVMHVGPYINLVSPTDPLCEDNFYSSDDLPEDPYTFQLYHLDEASAEARDPAGGTIASVVDMAHFARELLRSYDGSGSLLSTEGVCELWEARNDLGCGPGCPYDRYYGLGFFTDSQPGEPIRQVGHGGSRAGYTSAFVLRPERQMAVSILANADLSTVALSDLAKEILDDFEAVASLPDSPVEFAESRIFSTAPNPSSGTATIRFRIARAGPVHLEVFDVHGRRQTTLLDERRMVSGTHEIVWAAAREVYTPGTYFARLSAGNRTHTAKIVLMP